MFSILSHKNMQIKMTLQVHLSQNGYHQENKQQQIQERMLGKRNPYTLLVRL
jgi:hypothetical protein